VSVTPAGCKLKWCLLPLYYPKT